MCRHCEANEMDDGRTEETIVLAPVIVDQAETIQATEEPEDDRPECASCSERIDDGDETTSNDGDIYFRDWYSDRFTICDHCNVEIPFDDAICPSSNRLDCGPYCQECYDEKYGTCESCGCETRREEMSCGSDDCDYCDSCFCDHFSTCQDCGCTICNDDAVCTDDGTYCEDCAPTERESVDVPYISEAKTGFLTRRAFAIELEVIDNSRSSSDLESDDWESCRDGSLPDDGREYCSGPIGGQAGIDRINRAAAILAENNAKVTEACGFHLHIDASEENGACVARFLRVASRLESWAFSTTPKSRRNNTFCKRLRATAAQASTESDVELTVYERRSVSKSSKSEKYNQNRYFWLNAHSWFYRGTVEVRLHSGTTSAHKILEWARFWLFAFDFAKRSTLAEIDQVPTDELSGFWLMEKMGLPVSTVAYFAERIKKFARLNRELVTVACDQDQSEDE